MKLRNKLVLYNTITKVAIIGIMGLLLTIFIGRVSVNHLKQRLIAKRDKLIDGLSDDEITELLQKQASFTDYNILKQEYIVLAVIPAVNGDGQPHFTTGRREIDGEQQDYLIITDQFSYYGRAFQLEIGETMADTKQLEGTILLFTFIVLIIAVSVTLFVDLAFTRVLLSPFYKIIEQKINRVNDPSQYNYELVATTTFDFKLLDSSISGLMTKISELFAAEKQFISNISHELLTPVSVLRSRLENLLNEEGLSEASQVKVASSLKTLARLKSIVNSLLLISKVENNQFSRTDEVLLWQSIAEVTEDLQDRLEAKAIDLQVTLRDDVRFRASSSLMHTLFMNLVNNAIKYNKENGSITISDDADADFYRLKISDTGVGMSAGQIDRAFNRFEKSDLASEESHGLGLAIVKSIAAFHDIRIDVLSEQDTGTTITLSFAASSFV